MNKFYQLTNKSFDEKDVATYKELWEKVKEEHRGFCTSLHTEFKKSADNENRFHTVMSTATEDRHGDIVEQNWDLKAFKKNPIFLDSHNYSSIEHIIGKVHNIRVKDGALQGDVEFALDNPKGMLAFKMAKGGFLNATSVGFVPKQFDDKGNITKSELLEDSAVSVPANPEALFEKSVKEIGEELEKDSQTEEEVTEEPEEEQEEKAVEETQEEPVEQVEEEPVEEEIEEVEPTEEEKSAIKKWAKAENERRERLFEESLAVIRRLKEEQTNDATRKQMVNRAITQLLKAKN